MALRLEITGVAEKRAQLADLVANLEDMEDLWRRYGEIMSRQEGQWFATEGDGAWPPLRLSTQLQKIGEGYPLFPLVRSGALYRSLTDPLQAMDVSQGRSTLGTFTRKSMTWGTDVRDDRGREFAHYHQHTDPVTGEPMDYGTHPPERQVIPWPLPIQTQAALQAAAEDWVTDAIRRSGLS